MPKFGKRSKEALDSCHPDLKEIMNEAIKYYDFSVLEGHRSVERQLALYTDGKSKIDGVKKKGKHNYYPSRAVDIVPYPVDWEDANRFHFLAGLIFGIAERLRVEGKITHKLRWGGDFNMNMDFEDQKFIDYPHFELIK